MAVPPALQPLIDKYKTLPRPQQMAVLFVPPVILIGVGVWLMHREAGFIGAHPQVPSLLQRSDGVLADGSPNLWQQITDLDTQIAVQEQKIAQRPAIQAKLNGLREEIKEIQSLLPLNEEKTEIRELIQTLAREVPPEFDTVDVKSVKIDDSRSDPNSDYNTVLYQAEVTGTLNGLIAFMDSIEKPSPRNQRFMSINKINWKSGKIEADAKSSIGKASFGAHAVQFDVVTYIYQPKTKGRGR
jgi:hypothetical protein